MKKFLLLTIIIMCSFLANAQFVANARVGYGCGGATIEVVASGGVLPYKYNYEYESATGSNTWFYINGSPDLLQDYLVINSPFSSNQLCRVRVVDANNNTAQSNYFYVDPAKYNDPTGGFGLNANINFGTVFTTSVSLSVNYLTGGGRAPYTFFYKDNSTGTWIPFQTSRFINATYALADACNNNNYEFMVKDYCGNSATNVLSAGSTSWLPRAQFYVTQIPTSCNDGIISVSASGIGPLTYAMEYLENDTLDGTVPISGTVTQWKLTPYQTSPIFTGMPPGYYYAFVKDACGRVGASPFLGTAVNKVAGGNPSIDYPFGTISSNNPCKTSITLKPYQFPGGTPYTGQTPDKFGVQLRAGELMQWQDSPDFELANGSYYFAMKDACGSVSNWIQKDLSIPHATISGSTLADDNCGKVITLTASNPSNTSFTFGIAKSGGSASQDTLVNSTGIFNNVQPGNWLPFIQDACGYQYFLPATYGNTNHYYIEVPAAVPVVNITVSPYNNISAGQVATFTATVVNGGINHTFQWLKNGIVIPGATADTYVDNNPTAAVYSCRVSSFAGCGTGSTVTTSSNSISLSAFADEVAPCIPTIVNLINRNVHCIGYVGLGSINNYTNCEPNFFTAYTNLSTNAIVGSTQKIKLNSKAYDANINCSVYIDFNGDGDFDDADELVVNNALVDWQSNNEFTFNVPATAATGHHIMRVISDNPGYTVSGPCLTNLGEAEDYTINIQPFGTHCTPVVYNPCSNSTWIQNVTFGTINNNSDCSGGYADYSILKSTDAIAGGAVNYSVSSSGGGYISIYIDYNKDGDFDDAGETIADNISNYPVAGSFSLPATIPLGNYLVRIANESYFTGPIDNRCHVNSGEVEDYTLSVVPYVYCTPVVDAPCYQFWISNVSMGDLANSSACGSYTDYSHQLSVSATAGATIPFNITGTNYSGNTFNHLSIFIDYNNDGDFNVSSERVKDAYTGYPDDFVLPAGLASGNYRLRIVADANGNVMPCHSHSGEIEDYTLVVSSPANAYCVPYTSSACSNWISNVTIGNMTNTTDCSNNYPVGYSDYSTTKRSTVSPGQTVNFSLSTLGIQTSALNIYVDYNNDGDFDDADELVTASRIVTNPDGVAVGGNFTIPSTQPAGNYRLRVVGSLYPNLADPCYSYAGEMEDYTLAVASCSSLAGNIAVTGNGLQILNQDNTPSLLDSTDFGDVTLNTFLERTYTIYNHGNTDLHISGYGFSANTSAAFSVTNAPANIIAAGDHTSITLRFSPGLQTGATTMVLHINSDDCDESNFFFSIKATGGCPTDGPELDLPGTDPNYATDFGITPLNSTVNRTFTITNLGASTLHISNAYIAGYSSGQYQLVTPPATSIDPGNSTTLTVSFTPSSSGYIYDNLIINSDDCDEGKYIRVLVGTGTSGCIPTTSTTSWQACDSYTWNGTTYTSSGTYIYSTINAGGCDSTATLELIINSSTSSSTSITACNNYVWHGTVYTSSGTYTYHTTNLAGCDSTAALILVINTNATSSSTINVCSSYTWPLNGVTYTASGDYTYTTSNGSCSNVTTLHLTINSANSSTTSVSICSNQLPYTWNNNNYNAAGTYLVHLTNIAGCDSAATLVLMVNTSITSSTNIAECSSYTWPLNGVTYTVSGDYTYTTSNGSCTNVAALHLTINNPNSSTTNVSICSNQLPYTWNNNSYNAAGTYLVHLINLAGCDSAATLALTVNSSSTSSTTIAACGSYTWPLNGVTYTASGDYIYTVSNGSCTNVATLHLIISDPTYSTTNISICSNQLPYTWNNNSYNTAGTYFVHLTNLAGCDSTATLILSLNSPPATPAVINGPSNVCPYIGTGITTTYFVQPVPSNVVKYSWTLPVTINIVSATTDSSSITVSFDAGFDAGLNKIIKVKAIGCSGSSSDRSRTLSVSAPAVKPGPISGPADVCTMMVSAVNPLGNQATYTIRKIATAGSYNWVVPAGAVINAHPGGIGTANDTIIQVTFSSGFVKDTIRVTAVNGCNTSVEQKLRVYKLLPATPTTIYGDALTTIPPTKNVCPIPGSGIVETYAIKKVAKATSYDWSITGAGSANASIAHPNGPGINDTIILVSFGPAFTNATLSVQSVRDCGASVTARSINIHTIPAAPYINGNAEPCPSATEIYTATAEPGVGFVWTVPAATGTIVSGQGTSMLTIMLAPDFVSGSIFAKAVSGCGLSATKRFIVNKCAGAPRPPLPFTSIAKDAKPVMNIYPNPSDGNFRIAFDKPINKLGAKVLVEIVDDNGKMVYQHAENIYNNLILVKMDSKIANGIYLVRCTVNEEMIIEKIIINR